MATVALHPPLGSPTAQVHGWIGPFCRASARRPLGSDAQRLRGPCRAASAASSVLLVLRRFRVQRIAIDPEAKQAAEVLAPVKEYQALKTDFVASWGFLSEEDLVQRFLLVFVVGALPSFALAAAVYPLEAQGGGIALQNLLAASCYSFLGGSSLVFFAVVRFIGQWDTVNKLLSRRSYTVEYDPTAKMGYDSGSGGAYAVTVKKGEKEQNRDTLLAAYETEPVVARGRVYLLGSLGANVIAFIAANSAGGQFTAEREEQEEEDPVKKLFYKSKKKVCGAGCLPGLES